MKIELWKFSYILLILKKIKTCLKANWRELELAK